MHWMWETEELLCVCVCSLKKSQWMKLWDIYSEIWKLLNEWKFCYTVDSFEICKPALFTFTIHALFIIQIETQWEQQSFWSRMTFYYFRFSMQIDHWIANSIRAPLYLSMLSSIKRFWVCVCVLNQQFK